MTGREVVVESERDREERERGSRGVRAFGPVCLRCWVGL